MALQYQRGRGHPAKHRLATWRGGYHGDTFHPMSVCDPEGGMHALWTGVLPQSTIWIALTLGVGMICGAAGVLAASRRSR